jgi:hypothetical protein
VLRNLVMIVNWMLISFKCGYSHDLDINLDIDLVIDNRKLLLNPIAFLCPVHILADPGPVRLHPRGPPGVHYGVFDTGH